MYTFKCWMFFRVVGVEDRSLSFIIDSKIVLVDTGPYKVSGVELFLYLMYKY